MIVSAVTMPLSDICGYVKSFAKCKVEIETDVMV